MTAKLRRDIAWNLVPVALLAAIGLGLNIGIGGWWGPDALGVFNQVTTAYFVLAVFGALGINFSVLRAISAVSYARGGVERRGDTIGVAGSPSAVRETTAAQDERPHDEPSSTSAAPDEDRARIAAITVGGLVPAIALGALVTAIFVLARGAIAAFLESPPVAKGILWAAPGLFCFTVNKVLMSAVNGLGRMRAFAVYTSLRYLMLAAGFAIAAAAGLPAEQLAGIWSLSEGTLLLVLVVELVATVPLRRCAGWSTWAAEHLRYGVRGVGATLLFEINSRLDIWILGAALSDRMVGIYSMAASIAEGVSQLAVVVQVNVNPTIAADLATGRPDEVEALVGRSRRWFVPAMVGACALGAALFPLVIPWLTGDRAFLDGALPFATLLAGMALASPWLPFNQILLMGKRPGWHTIYVAITVAANVVLNLALIPSLGLMGAATATALVTFASAVWLRRLARALVGVRL